MATHDPERSPVRFRLSQETIAIITVGIALAGLNLASVSDLREEARTDRAAWQTAVQANHAAWQANHAAWQAAVQADRAAWQAEARANREAFERRIESFERRGEAFERRMEALQKQVVGLSIEQARLAAVVEPE